VGRRMNKTKQSKDEGLRQKKLEGDSSKSDGSLHYNIGKETYQICDVYKDYYENGKKTMDIRQIQFKALAC